MKFTIKMKTPDVVTRAVDDITESEHVDGALEGASDNEIEEAGWVVDERRDDLKKLLSKWFNYGECVTIEIDTEAGTATVLEA